MKEIVVQVDTTLMNRVSDLAEKYYGDRSDASIYRVVASSLHLYLTWLHHVKGGEHENEEPSLHWDFGEEAAGADGLDEVRLWLFRRR